MVAFILGLILIGLVAGFSTILYATQVAVLGSKKAPFQKSFILLSGVGAGLLLLTLIFFLTQPETFQVTSIWEVIKGYRTNAVDMFLGLLCIGGGISSIIVGQRAVTKPIATPKMQKGVGSTALFGLGFIRAITRVSGVAALLLGVRTIVHATDLLFFQCILLAALLAAAMLPYAVIVGARYWYPLIFSRIERVLTKARSLRPYYSIGIFLVIVGMVFLTLSLAV